MEPLPAPIFRPKARKDDIKKKSFNMKKQKHNVHGEATASAPRGKGRGYVGTAELYVKHDGTKVFFDEYHTTKQEACELICAELGI